MELKPGFKQTEVGVIPEDWDVCSLNDLSTMKSGISITSANIDQYSKFPCYGGNGLRGYTTQCTHDGAYALIGRQGALCGNVLRVDGQFFASEHAIVVTPLQRTDINWLTFVLGVMHLNRYSESSAQPGLSVSKIQKLTVATPPIKTEQTAIANALSDADALIQSLTRLIVKKRQIKQGAMQALLNPYENGRLKEGWVVKKLEEIADVIDPHPSHRAPPVAKTGIPFVGIGDLNEKGDLINNKVRIVSESIFFEHSERYNLNDELIGLGRVASIGKVVRLKNSFGKYAISPTLGIIKGKEVSRNYLCHILNTKMIADQFAMIMSGSTRSSVGVIVLRKLNIQLPKESDEQTRIATILSGMDAEIAALETKLTKYQHIKQGMMQNLLTGKIRLI